MYMAMHQNLTKIADSTKKMSYIEDGLSKEEW